MWTWSGFASNGNKWPDNNTSEYRTWSDLMIAFPSARVLPGDSWLGIRVGEPGPTGYTGDVASFTLGTVSGTTTFNFEPVVAQGEITSPANDGDHVTGILNLAATYNDGDVPNTDDSVQWAVRQGTCAAGAGTVLGNVDGHSDVATWDGNYFSFTADVSSFTPGNYCFVFNPTDDAGQPNVRLTRNFIIDAPVVLVGPPTDKNECKNDGWKTFNNPTFKNQGDCVSYVQSNPHAVANKNK
jgi:hypothetical protein